MSGPHMTRVAVANRTGGPLLDLRVVHVFGDRTPELLDWEEPVQPGRRSKTRNVAFGTGLGSMSDYDWWQVSWRTSEGGQDYLHSSSPSFWNLVGNYLVMQGEGAAAAAGGIPAAAGAGDIAKGSAALGGDLARLLLGGIARKMDKAHFKEHMLKDADAYLPGDRTGIGLLIAVLDDGRLAFESPSGTSGCDYSTMAVPAEI